MAWRMHNNDVGWQPITTRETTQQHKLGACIQAVDDDYGVGEFQYVKGVASCEQYDWVTINADDWSITRSAANAIGPVGIAMAALTASYYGWVQRKGKAVGQCLTQYADNGAVFLTATAGAVDDTSVAGDLVMKAKGASTTVVDSGVADFEIDYPFVNDRTANK